MLDFRSRDAVDRTQKQEDAWSAIAGSHQAPQVRPELPANSLLTVSDERSLYFPDMDWEKNKNEDAERNRSSLKEFVPVGSEERKELYNNIISTILDGIKNDLERDKSQDGKALRDAVDRWSKNHDSESLENLYPKLRDWLKENFRGDLLPQEAKSALSDDAALVRAWTTADLFMRLEKERRRGVPELRKVLSPSGELEEAVAKSGDDPGRLDSFLKKALSSEPGYLAALNEMLAPQGRKMTLDRGVPGPERAPLAGVDLYKMKDRNGGKGQHLVDTIKLKGPLTEENLKQLREFVLSGKTPLDEHAQLEKQRLEQVSADSSTYELRHLSKQLCEIDQMFTNGLFNSIDQNKDGYISQDEIKKFCASNPEQKQYAAALAVARYNERLGSNDKGVSLKDIHALTENVREGVEKLEESESVRNVMIGSPGPGRPSPGFRGFDKILQRARESDPRRQSEYVTAEDVKRFLNDPSGFSNKDQVYNEGAHADIEKVLTTLLTKPDTKLTVADIRAFPSRVREENKGRRFQQGIDLMKEYWSKF